MKNPGRYHLLFLPPYSPNLNIIERLWKFTKKEILNALYYDSPTLFHQAINTFFQNINNDYLPDLQKFPPAWVFPLLSQAHVNLS